MEDLARGAPDEFRFLPGGADAPHWDELPIVLLDGQRVRAATSAAGRLRIKAGMTIAEARSRCAELRVASWEDETIARAVTRATAAFVQASPQVTPAAGSPGTWWIGASGLESLGGEAWLARQLLAIARRWHPAARVGIADSCVAARAATWATPSGGRRSPGTGRKSSTRAHDARMHEAHMQGARPTDADARATAAAGRSTIAALPEPGDPSAVIVPPGGCAPYLAPAPLGLVPMDDELRETLQALGVRTVGAFAALAAEDVERRWGALGVSAWHLARGDDLRRPVLARLDAPRAVATDLCPSVPSMEPILFLVRAALDRLVEELVHDGRAAAVVAITLALDDARGALPVPTRTHTVTREIRLPRALARAVPLLERCRALLETWTLQAPVCGVTVAVTATTPLQGAQGELLDPAWRDPAAADAAFARLRSALGTGAVVRPVLHDTHRPEGAGAWEQVEDAGDGGRGTGDGGGGGAGRGSGARDGQGDERVRYNHAPPTTAVRAAGGVTGSAAGGTASSAAGGTTGGAAGGIGGRTTASETVPVLVPSLPHAPATASERTPARGVSSPPAFPLALVRESPAAIAAVRPHLTHPPALRQLDPPERIEVRTVDGAPRAIRWRQQVITVSRAIGPERLTGDWWTAGYARDYWRCEDARGTSDLVLYRDCSASAPSWYLHAWYD